MLENGDQRFVDTDDAATMSISGVSIQSDATSLKINLPGKEDFAPRGSGTGMLGVVEAARWNKTHVDIALPPLPRNTWLK